MGRVSSLGRRFFRVLCILVVAGVLATGCSSVMKEPQVSVTDVSLSSVSLSRIVIEVTFSIDNPNAVGVTLDSLTFDIHTKHQDDWLYLAHGEQAGLEIEPGKNVVTIPVVVDNSELIASVARSLVTGEITLQVKGIASADVLSFNWDIPFAYTRTIPLNLPWR